MAHEVFISYAEEDESTARAIAEKLKASGINSWASFKVEPGQDWLKEIIGAIKQSQVFILIFSAASNVSKFVAHEAQAAFLSENDILIIPFIIETVTPTDKLQFIMGGRQWLKAAPPKEEHYAKLTGWVSRWLSRRAPGAQEAARPGAGSKKASKKAAKKTSGGLAAKSVRTQRAAAKKDFEAALAGLETPGRGTSAKKSPPLGATPEALLSHIAAAAKEWPGTSRRKRPTSGALGFFLSFLGLRHGSTVSDARAIFGDAPAKSADKNHLALHYPAKGLSIYYDSETRRVSLVAVKALDSASWKAWRRKQPDLKYLGKSRGHIVAKFGQPNSKIEVSRLNPEILDYDFTGLRGRSGYVAFHCPEAAGGKCTSLQVHWLQ